MKRNRKRTKENYGEKACIIGIFLASFMIRAMLIILSPYNQAQHDTHFFGEWSGNAIGSGHFGYIQYFVKFSRLPDFDPRQVWGMYNPPLHHILCAIWIKLNRWLGLGYEACIENLQVLTLSYSSMTIYTGYRILKEFSIKGNALCLVFGMLAFHPIFAILSLSLNNDALSVLCSAVAILYTIRWYKVQKTSYILCIALSVGLGMMTKLSVGLLAPAIAFVFLAVLIQKKPDWKKLIKQFAGFGLLCIPLGLAWPIRSNQLFGIPFDYVQPLGKADQWQYIGDYNLWQRLGVPSLEPLFRNPWYIGNPSDQHNVWMEMFRTAVLDEWAFQLPDQPYVILATGLVFVSILLGLTAGVLFMWMLVKKGTMDRVMKGMCGTAYVGLIGSFVKFSLDYPYICSMNFRYIVPTLFFSILGTGIWLENENRSKVAVTLVTGLGVLFIVLSVVLLVNYSLLFKQPEVQNLAFGR